MRSSTGTALLAGVLLVAGCTSTPAPTTGSPSTAVSSTPTATGTATRSTDTLKAALLGAADVPQGWTVYDGSQPTSTQTTTSQVTSNDPKCAAFVELAKDPPEPLPATMAKVEFDGGNLKPPFIVETVEAYPSAAAAAAAFAAQGQAVSDCATVTYTLDGRTSPVTIKAVDPPSLPVPATASDLRASTGDLSGYHSRQLVMQVQDTVVGMAFFRATDDQVASVSAAAAAKAQKVLG